MKLIPNKRKLDHTKDGRILVFSKLEKLSISDLNNQENLHKNRIKFINEILDEDNFEFEKDRYLDVLKKLDQKKYPWLMK